jgi:hypothetical protein
VIRELFREFRGKRQLLGRRVDDLKCIFQAALGGFVGKDLVAEQVVDEET